MKKITITTSWDDGHILDLRLAALLRKYNLPATFYISPGNREIAPPDRLNKAQVAELGRDFEIGAHTVTHPRLTQITDATARKEIAGSKKILESILGREVKMFCYPGGSYYPRHKQMVRDAGFAGGRTVDRFATGTGGDPFAMPTTIHAYRHWSDVLPILHEAKSDGFFKLYRNWDDLAITTFDNLLTANAVGEAEDNNAIFHLWGHSWEIEKDGDWNRLERVFQHIANRPDVSYATNGALI